MTAPKPKADGSQSSEVMPPQDDRPQLTVLVGGKSKDIQQVTVATATSPKKRRAKTREKVTGVYAPYNMETPSLMLRLMFMIRGLIGGLAVADIHFMLRLTHHPLVIASLPVVLTGMAWWLVMAQSSGTSSEEQERKMRHRVCAILLGLIFYIPIRMLIHVPILSLIPSFR